jgi:hypothetical protein
MKMHTDVIENTYRRNVTLKEVEGGGKATCRRKWHGSAVTGWLSKATRNHGRGRDRQRVGQELLTTTGGGARQRQEALTLGKPHPGHPRIEGEPLSMRPSMRTCETSQDVAFAEIKGVRLEQWTSVVVYGGVWRVGDRGEP